GNGRLSTVMRKPVRKTLGWLGMHRVFAAFVGAMVVLAALAGGRTYLYCRAMGEIMNPTCLCARAGSQSQDRDASSWVDGDCFEVRVLDRLISSTPPSSDGIVPAACLLAQAQPALEQRPVTPGIAANARHPIRAGPLSPAAFRATLMVFLT